MFGHVLSQGCIVNIMSMHQLQLKYKFKCTVNIGLIYNTRLFNLLPTDHAAPYKRLRGGVIIVDKIPKTGSGKLLKRHLRDQTVAAPVNSRL